MSDISQAAREAAEWYWENLTETKNPSTILRLACQRAIDTSQEGLIDAEQKRWQDAIDELIHRLNPKIEVDGSGCDSGDPLDLTLTEIQIFVDAHVEASQAEDKDEIARLKSELGEWEISKESVEKSSRSQDQRIAELEAQLKYFRAPDTDSVVSSCDCLAKTNAIVFHHKGCRYRLISERDSLAVRVEELEAILSEHARGNVTFHLEAKGLAARLKLQERVADLEKERDAYHSELASISKTYCGCDFDDPQQVQGGFTEGLVYAFLEGSFDNIEARHNVERDELRTELSILRERVGPLVEEFRRTIQHLNLYGYDTGLLATALADFERTEGGGKCPQ